MANHLNHIFVVNGVAAVFSAHLSVVVSGKHVDIGTWNDARIRNSSVNGIHDHENEVLHIDLSVNGYIARKHKLCARRKLSVLGMTIPPSSAISPSTVRLYG